MKRKIFWTLTVLILFSRSALALQGPATIWSGDPPWKVSTSVLAAWNIPPIPPDAQTLWGMTSRPAMGTIINESNAPAYSLDWALLTDVLENHPHSTFSAMLGTRELWGNQSLVNDPELTLTPMYIMVRPDHSPPVLVAMVIPEPNALSLVGLLSLLGLLSWACRRK